MNLPENIIGVDLGGTHIRAGKITNNTITKIIKEPTPAAGTVTEVLEKISEVISQCIDKHTTAIGIGVPSVVDTARGIVYDVVNIPSWKEVALKDFLMNRFRIPVYVNNDSNCFAAGEKIYGKGKPHSNIVGITLGTGLGIGLVINGQLYEGRNCGAGEFGNIPYRDSAFESYCSGQFFSKIKNTDGAHCYQKALAGEKDAMELFNEFGHHMGILINAVLYAYDPDIIILGGSLSQAFGLFGSSMYKEIESFAYRNVLSNLKIEVSELSDSAILGAAALKMKSLSSNSCS